MLNLSLTNLDRHAQPYLILQNRLPHNLRAEIFHLIRRHAWVLLTAITTMLILAILYISIAPRIYTAHAQLLLDPRNPQPIGEQDKEMTMALENPELESQITILLSEQILAAVVTELKLYSDLEFVPSRDGEQALTAEQRTPPNSTGMLKAVTSVRKALDVRRVGLSHTLDIYFSSRDPEKAARIANAVADAYVKDQLETRSRIASQGTTWLEERIEQLRQQVNAAVLKTQEFRAKRDYRIQEPPSTGAVSAPAEHSQQITLDELESTAATYRKLYESYLQAYTGSVQRQALPGSMARVITRATPPATPSHPRKLILLTVSIFLGLLIGYGIALIRHLLDKSITRPLQLQKADLNWLGELREINRPPGHETGGESHFNWARRFFCARQMDCLSNRVRLVPDEPLSRFSVEMRTLESNLILMTKGKPLRYLGVTPAASTLRTAEVTSNLAYLYAIKGKRVLLVDANMHSPTLTRWLSTGAKKGFADVLLGSAEAQDCVVVNAVGGVDLLPAGVMEGSTNATWTFAPEQLKERLAQILGAYDVVLFDLPAACDQTATLSIGTVLEAVIIVADYGRTQIPFLNCLSTAFHSAMVEFVGVAVAMAD